MNVLWEPAPGKVRKYIVRYKTPEEEAKEVGWGWKRFRNICFPSGLAEESEQV